MKLFDVSVRGAEPCFVSAKSASAARYQRFLDVSDIWDINFRDFLSICKVKVSRREPDDCYAYIRRAYGVHLKVGQRVSLIDHKGANPLDGVVGYALDNRHYAHVFLDGKNHASLFHPSSVQVPA